MHLAIKLFNGLFTFWQGEVKRILNWKYTLEVIESLTCFVEVQPSTVVGSCFSKYLETRRQLCMYLLSQYNITANNSYPKATYSLLCVSPVYWVISTTLSCWKCKSMWQSVSQSASQAGRLAGQGPPADVPAAYSRFFPSWFQYSALSTSLDRRDSTAVCQMNALPRNVFCI